MTRSRALFLTASILFSAICTICGAQPKSVFKEIYARRSCTVLKEPGSVEIAGFAAKGETLLLIRPAFSMISDTTSVESFKVRTPEGAVGYVSSEYLTFDKNEARERYMPDYYDPLHSKAKDSFHGGDPLGCDYFPRARFEGGKPMPQACYSLYLNCGSNVIGNIDAYIAIAKRTKINCFVIDLKEDGAPGFKAETMERLCPSAYKRAADNAGLYRTIVEKLHKEGIWAVGRIVVFKDYHFTKDHPECALWDKRTGQMLLHNKSHWPSAYSRKVWEYNVSLAVEAVDRFGFDEINFDYVRFPDRMNSIESCIEMRNRYNESKVQAIQRFVTYAADAIHAHGAYLSIDVFGECANPGYTTAYGQYWPAISNVVDVMCGMPYPDHFSNGYYGIQKPWNHPFEIMKAWGTHVQNRQAETPTPARVRTWVQAYHVMKHVDPSGIDYNAANIAKEIRGLYAAGLTDGYVTWLASSNIERYRTQEPAFVIDYLNE